MTDEIISRPKAGLIEKGKNPTRKSAIGLALFVTILWSTSWVLIRFGLEDVPPLTFAGVRYTIAAACLVPFLFTHTSWQVVRGLSRAQWGKLLVYGVVFYTVAQGAQYVGLNYLPMATVSLILNLTTLVVAGVGLTVLSEKPTVLQWMGIVLNLSGIALFFYPPKLVDGAVIGIAVSIVCMLANAAGTVMGRDLNRSGSIPALVVTAVSMGIGAIIMLGAGLAMEGMPTISLASWAGIIWMAVVNTALAFTLWNYTQRTLLAAETSIVANMMTVFIAILGWVFVGESLTAAQIIGIILATVGTMLVQLRRLRRVNPQIGT